MIKYINKCTTAVSININICGNVYTITMVATNVVVIYLDSHLILKNTSFFDILLPLFSHSCVEMLLWAA